MVIIGLCRFWVVAVWARFTGRTGCELFEEEARIMAELGQSSPYIVKVDDFGNTDNMDGNSFCDIEYLRKKYSVSALFQLSSGVSGFRQYSARIHCQATQPERLAVFPVPVLC